jgi:hypothetical protein
MDAEGILECRLELLAGACDRRLEGSQLLELPPPPASFATCLGRQLLAVDGVPARGEIQDRRLETLD